MVLPKSPTSTSQHEPVKSWSIPFDFSRYVQRRSSDDPAQPTATVPTKSSAAPVRASSVEYKTESALQEQTRIVDAPEVVRGVRTTGFFSVPSGDGNIIELVVMISSDAPRSQTIDVFVDEQIGDTVRPVFFQSVDVPAGGGRRLVIGDVENKSIRVSIAPATAIALHPSASVTQTFIADGGVLIMRHRAPAFFIPV